MSESQFPAGAESIGMIMGVPVSEAFETLRGMYGDDIAMEVLRIGRMCSAMEKPTTMRLARSITVAR